MSLHRPFYTYRQVGTTSPTFVIENIHGELLIGDQLPSTAQEAALLCRVANVAHEQAIAAFKARLITVLKEANFSSEIRAVSIFPPS